MRPNPLDREPRSRADPLPSPRHPHRCGRPACRLRKWSNPEGAHRPERQGPLGGASEASAWPGVGLAQANGAHPDKTRGRHQPVQAEAVRPPPSRQPNGATASRTRAMTDRTIAVPGPVLDKCMRTPAVNAAPKVGFRTPLFNLQGGGCSIPTAGGFHRTSVWAPVRCAK
jgi:hypothetical protein